MRRGLDQRRALISGGVDQPAQRVLNSCSHPPEDFHSPALCAYLRSLPSLDTTTTTDIQSRISKSTDSVLWFEARVDQQRAEHVDADRGAQSDRPERDNCQAARRAIWASPAPDPSPITLSLAD
jgi:hypothetical protein